MATAKILCIVARYMDIRTDQPNDHTHNILNPYDCDLLGISFYLKHRAVIIIHIIASDCNFVVVVVTLCGLWQQLRYPYFISKIRPSICSGATYCTHNMHAIQPTIQNCYLPIAFSSNARMISIDTICFHFFSFLFCFFLLYLFARAFARNVLLHCS